jgi:hypothetical protein
MRDLGEDRTLPILVFPLPKTVKQLRIFLGVTAYCRFWILGYADLAQPLYHNLKEAQKDSQSLLNGMTCQEMNSTSSFLVLGLPVQEKFQLYVCGKGGLALGVVTQLCGIISSQ